MLLSKVCFMSNSDSIPETVAVVVVSQLAMQVRLYSAQDMIAEYRMLFFLSCSGNDGVSPVFPWVYDRSGIYGVSVVCLWVQSHLHLV